MNESTKYLLTLLHLQKLSRMKCGTNYPTMPWSSFKLMKEAAEGRYGFTFETTETNDLLKTRGLVKFAMTFWENASQPEY